MEAGLCTTGGESSRPSSAQARFHRDELGGVWVIVILDTSRSVANSDRRSREPLLWLFKETEGKVESNFTAVDIME